MLTKKYTMSLTSIPTRHDIETAHRRIIPYIHKTPVMTSAGVNAKAGCELFFKCENFQKIGAFKARGAMNAILSIPETKRFQGVATHSSGNHGQAVARAAQLMQVRSYIVMPNTAPDVKKNGVIGFGGEVFECEPTLQARERTLAAVIMKTKATEIHPFNNYDVIAGQSTAAIELYEEYNKLDAIIAPIGGGGLLSGIALATQYFSPATTVYAAEPEGADDAFRSMKSGKIEPSQSKSISDGLLTSLGTKTFPIIQKSVKKVITVSDQETVEAMKLIWERMKIIVEPSCAVPLAAVIKSPEVFQGKKVGVILTGGNVDLKKAFALFEEYC
jgi:threonine dehydratase